MNWDKAMGIMAIVMLPILLLTYFSFPTIAKQLAATSSANISSTVNEMPIFLIVSMILSVVIGISTYALLKNAEQYRFAYFWEMVESQTDSEEKGKRK